MKIELEDDTKKEIQKAPFYITAIFIAISGLGILFFTVYYIAFLPVPIPMEPLKVRVLTTLQLEEAQKQNMDVVEIVQLSDESKTGIRAEPSKSSIIIFEVFKGDFYEKLEEKGEWIKIREKQDNGEGWIEKDYVEEVGSQ